MRIASISLLAILVLVLLSGCAQKSPAASGNLPSGSGVMVSAPVAPAPSPLTNVMPDRGSAIPSDAIKMAPETDPNPPKSKSSGYSDPIPLPSPINTAGAEDSAFITPDGGTLYFFFTPDVRVPANKQLFDNVTGIYVSHKDGADGSWSNPERVFLTEPGKLALDGCGFVQGNRMWFCSAREGYAGINWFTADFVGGKWTDWKSADFDPGYKVGELHITTDGNELYFHSDRPGGKGDYDVWVSKKAGGVWQEPENVAIVNTERMDGWPFVSQDGNELWFYRDYGLWRSLRINGTGTVWGEPELMFSPLAGEASLDNEGNVYFTHHFFKNDTMIEADIYIAKPIPRP